MKQLQCTKEISYTNNNTFHEQSRANFLKFVTHN